jgi:Ca2+-binding EF-hand superfamily protein
VFEKMDTDHDGCISKQEFLTFCLRDRQKLTNFKSKSMGIMSNLSTIDASDFKTLVSSDNEGVIKRLVDKIFTTVDRNDDGEWSYDEVKAMLTQLSYQ